MTQILQISNLNEVSPRSNKQGVNIGPGSGLTRDR